MRSPRAPGWWYELRYGPQGPLILGCVAVAAIGIGLHAFGFFAWFSARLDTMEAECRAHGGFVDHGRAPKSGVLRVCKGVP